MAPAYMWDLWPYCPSCSLLLLFFCCSQLTGPCSRLGGGGDVVDASERHRPSAASLASVGYSGDPPPPLILASFFLRMHHLLT